MSELRQNLATREWVIISPERLKGKSFNLQQNDLMDTIPQHDDNCPFCPGNEDRFSTVELFSVPHPDPNNKHNSPWKARCIENKYKVFQEYDDCPIQPVEFQKDGIYRKLKGCGNHELVIESSIHNRTLATMTTSEVEGVVQCYLQRFNDLKKNHNNLLSIIFKNHGRRSGASQTHPHSQILGSRVVPNYLRFLYDEATRFFDSNGICVFCKMIHYELQEDIRIIYQNERFVAMIPYAANVPFETHIYPKTHDALFGDMGDAEAVDFSECLQVTMRKIYTALSNPDFNIVFRNPPYAMSGVPFYHWHLQIIPHTKIPGGFEQGSRVNVNIMPPEDSAKILKDV